MEYFLLTSSKALENKQYTGGGATQLLFGIKGFRWDSVLEKTFYNEHWIRPDSSERPKGAEKVEGACYW